ncbi:unnamed protein product [Blepharisma stoltei]|uniref:CCZ1/INTU/HSP4 first Longin domain-containing protein n=1 Tax=Blepharisma stoltei TaxID=1481888 RepID=A0AAU9IPT7_9CILI|nr:unnamed protein product [Blepharisma stoltei]
MEHLTQNNSIKLSWRWLLLSLLTHPKQPPIKLQVLDTVFIDSENNIDLWVYTDNIGYIHSKPKSYLKSTEIVRFFLRHNLSKEEQSHFKNALDNKDDWLKIQYRDRKTCFSVRKDGTRKILYLSNLTKLMGQSFPMVFQDIEALQLYKFSMITYDFFYVVSIDPSEDSYKIDIKKIIYNHNYPNRISRIEHITDNLIKESFKKVSNDLMSSLSGICTIIHCEFLFIEDKQNKLWLAGCQNSTIFAKSFLPKSRSHDEINIDPTDKYKLPSLNSSFFDSTAISSPQGHNRTQSNIIPAKFLLDSDEKVLIRSKVKHKLTHTNVVDRVQLTNFSAVIRNKSMKSQSVDKIKLPKSVWKIKKKKKNNVMVANERVVKYINERNDEDSSPNIRFRYFPRQIKGESKVFEAINRVFSSKSWLN